MTACLHVSLAALRHNAAVLRRLVAPSRSALVVKGNAYGHGLLAVARAVEASADRLCVYALEEGLALRAGGIAVPVLVLGPVASEGLEEAVAADLELAVWSGPEFGRRLARAAGARDRPASVHLKLDSGLNRLGFDRPGFAAALAELGRRPEIAVRGLFSHLASAEELDSPATLQQLEVFQAACEVAPASAPAPLRHIAASAAAMLWPQTRLDMTRIGIALYGLLPSPQTAQALGAQAPDLRPALSYRSKLVAVREVEAGSAIGYGGSFHVPRRMRVGVVPAGYADGVPRALSNRGAFVLCGALAPVVGRVAMNMTEIDLTGIPAAAPGTPVTLIGREGGASVTADDWARWAETINYEIVTRLPPDLPRIYDA